MIKVRPTGGRAMAGRGPLTVTTANKAELRSDTKTRDGEAFNSSPGD